MHAAEIPVRRVFFFVALRPGVGYSVKKIEVVIDEKIVDSIRHQAGGDQDGAAGERVAEACGAF
jgi:hypothetical protein